MAKYASKDLEQMYARPKWYYHIPLVGYVTLMIDLNKNEKAAGLLDKETPGGAYIAEQTKKMMKFIIPFLLIMIVTLITVLPQWYYWKKHIFHAIDLNRNANLY